MMYLGTISKPSKNNILDDYAYNNSYKSVGSKPEYTELAPSGTITFTSDRHNRTLFSLNVVDGYMYNSNSVQANCNSGSIELFVSLTGDTTSEQYLLSIRTASQDRIAIGLKNNKIIALTANSWNTLYSQVEYDITTLVGTTIFIVVNTLNWNITLYVNGNLGNSATPNGRIPTTAGTYLSSLAADNYKALNKKYDLLRTFSNPRTFSSIIKDMNYYRSH